MTQDIREPLAYFKKQQDALYQLILDADRKAAIALLKECVSDAGYRKTLITIIEPTLQKVGERFLLDKLSLAQGYLGKNSRRFFGDPTCG